MVMCGCRNGKEERIKKIHSEFILLLKSSEKILFEAAVKSTDLTGKGNIFISYSPFNYRPGWTVVKIITYNENSDNIVRREFFSGRAFAQWKSDLKKVEL